MTFLQIIASVFILLNLFGIVYQVQSDNGVKTDTKVMMPLAHVCAILLVITAFY